MKHALALVSVLLPLLGSCRREHPPSNAASEPGDPRARALADRVLERMGGRAAWEGTRYISWNFMGQRHHLWDKFTNDLRYENGQRTCLMNLGTREGRAFDQGVEVTDAAARKAALEKTYAAFINDSYWMFMPYKLRDTGVRLAYLGDRRTTAGKDAEVLELTFEGVGITPANRYHVFIGKESGLVEQWDYFPTREDENPKLSTVWNVWKTFGRILLCTDHGDGHDWQIAVYDDVPRAAFLDPAPPRLP